MKELIKTLKDLAFDVEKAPSMQQTSVDTTMKIDYNEPTSWNYKDIEKRMYEADVREELFKDFIDEGSTSIGIQTDISPKLAEETCEREDVQKLIYNIFYDKIKHMMFVLNYYLVTRNYDLVAVPDKEIMLHLTSPVMRKFKNSKGEEEITWVVEVIGRIKINIINKD